MINLEKTSNLKQMAMLRPTISKMVNSNTPKLQPKKKSATKYILGGVILLFLTIGSGASLFLTQVNQDIRQQADVGPMCLSIDLIDSQTGLVLTEDPSFGDSVRFTCAQVANIENYIFRVIEPDNNIVDLAATGRTSESFTISKDGRHFAQCQICTTSDDDSCNSYAEIN